MKPTLSLLLLSTLLTAGLPAFGQGKTPATADQMNKVYAEYWEETMRANPIAATFNGDNRFNDKYGAIKSDERREDARKLAEKYLARTAAFDPAPLPAEDRISYDLLRYNLQQTLDSLQYPSNLIPLDQFSGLHLSLAQLGSGRTAQPFNTVKDYDNWLARASHIGAAVDETIADMRRGMAKGLVLPKVLVRQMLPQLENVGTTDLDKSTFMAPVKKFPAGFSDADKTRLTRAYTVMVQEQLAPAFARLLAFTRESYLPAARETVGMGALPGGAQWYAFAARRSTSTDLTPEQVHAIGLAEVARIRGLFEEAKGKVGFKGSFKEFIAYLNTAPELRFKTREEMQAAYEQLRPVVEAKAATIFSIKPKNGYEIRPVEGFREVSAAPAQISPGTADGTRPTIFYYNAYKPETRTRFTTMAYFLHEAVPGHHFEISLARERTGLPDFRRFGGNGAFSEGWGLYSEMLGKEMGLYEDQWQWVGRLTAEMWRAVRLVVDTGIHAKGWSREQAIAYFSEHVPQGENVAVQEVERYIAIPGQALSYKIGELKFRELRTRAEKALGPAFDIRAFHTEVLTHGSVPLSVLEAAVDRWIAAQKSAKG